MSTPTRSRSPQFAAPASGATVLAALGFPIAYLAVGFAQGALADRALPLPDASVTDAAAYYAANPLAAGVAAGLQVASVVCFAIVVWAFTNTMRQSPSAERSAMRLRAVGFFSVAAMVVSSALTAVIIGIANSGGSADLIGLLRQAGFYAGGVANVAALGLFGFAGSRILGRLDWLGKPSRWLGYVAGTVAMLSVLSVAVYYANALLPLGRVLSMAWTVVAAIIVLRRDRSRR